MEIKIDKSTLPKDGDKVKFLIRDEWYSGDYIDEDQMFWVDEATWFFAWQVEQWEFDEERNLPKFKDFESQYDK